MRRARLVSASLAVAALLFTVAILLVRHRSISNVAELVIAVGAPFATLTIAAFVSVVTILGRRILLSVLALAVLSASVWTQASWYFSPRPVDIAGEWVELRVLSSNLRLGRADATTFVTLAERHADVVMVSELTSAALERFTRAGLADTFPHSVLAPSAGAGGIGLWSRYPVSSISDTQPRDYTVAAARVQVPGAQIEPLIASVHVESPVAGKRDTVAEWRIGISAMKAALSAFAVNVGGGAVVVAGDFNSTPDMRQFRDLSSGGYRDAVEQTGSGFAPTFPSRTWHPPLLTIDHILTRNAAASSIETVYIPGSDHRALLGTIRIPAAPQHP
ncbi:endonuclease [Mycobacterium sp. djl-10]|nr:endonuclease [Mycobacterium sp. djl-10]